MNLGVPGRPGWDVVNRLPFVRSLSYHTRRVLGRPVRTGVTVVVGIALLVGGYLLAFEQEALLSVVERETVSVLDVLALVDPWLWPVFLVGGTVLVVVSEIWSGVQRDMRFRRQR